LKIENKEYGQRLTEEEAAYVDITIRNLATQLMRYSRRSGGALPLMEALLEAGEVAQSLSKLSFGSIDEYFSGLQNWTTDQKSDETPYGRNRALDEMCSGALQVVASRLSGVTQGGPKTKVNINSLMAYGSIGK